MTPIVHITDKEQALLRENANMLNTINKQAASIEKLRKVVEMKDLTIEAQASEIEGWKADQKENIAVTFKQQAEIDKLKAACDKFSESEMLLKAQPVQPAPLPETETTRTVDRSWAQFCAGIGDSKDAPYPGMIAAFESHYGQSFADKDWRNEASVWAQGWQAAIRAQPVQSKTGNLVMDSYHAMKTMKIEAQPVQPALTDAVIVLPREMDEDLYYIVGGAMGAQSPEQCGRADGLWKQLVARADYDALRTGGAG